jgi:uncharacterized protein YqgC (DUF456 family)
MKNNSVIEVLKKIFGIILIIIGILSLFLPILPGIVLIIIGLFFLNDKGINRMIKRKLGIVKKKKD